MSDKGIIPVVASIGWTPKTTTTLTTPWPVRWPVRSTPAAADADRRLGVDKSGTLMPDLTVAQCRDLQEDGTISGGMILKVETCIDAVNQGVEGAVIIDGRVPHGVLEPLPNMARTLIRR